MIFEPLQSSPALYVSVAALLGLMVGSFLNVVIHRLPRMMEREWREQCSTMDGEGTPPCRTLQSGCSALGLPVLRPHDFGMGKRSA